MTLPVAAAQPSLVAQAPRPAFFISAGTELAACRKALKHALLEMGARAVEMQDFTVAYGPLQGVLHQLLLPCDAVFHIVGSRYGMEPGERTLGAPRRSFAHYELDVARSLGKPLYCFVAAAGCPTEPAPPEDDARCEIQHRHRAEIERGGGFCEVFTSPEDLGRRVRALRRELFVRRRVAYLPRRALGVDFVGRVRLLAMLHEELAPGRAVVLHPPEEALLSGGWGKTTVAIEAAWRAYHEGRFDFVLFLSAGPRADLEAALAALSRGDALALLPDEVVGHRARLDAVLDWLRAEANVGRWLLIFDGVDSEATWAGVLGFLPSLRQGAVLLTGRLRSWRGAQAMLPVGPFSSEQAREFLAKRITPGRTPTPTERTGCERIGAALECLPLGLELVASHLRETPLTGVEFLAKNATAGRIPLAAVLERSVDRLDPAARALFYLLLCLAPQPAVIPLALFDRHGDGPRTRTALAALQRRSLIVADDSGLTVSVHRLVREIARDRLSPDDFAAALGAARAAVDAALPRSDSAGGAVTRELLVPHCRALLGQLNGHPLETHAASLAQTLAHWLKDCGRPAEAEPFFRRALTIEEKNRGPARPEVAARLRDLGGALRAMGRARAAEPLYRRALRIVERTCGPSQPETASALDDLAACLCATNRLEEAETLLRRALAIRERQHGHSHPKTAIGVHRLAAVLESRRRPEEAAALYERALEIDEQTFGERHPRVAARLFHLAGALAAARRRAEAEIYFRRAVAMDEEKLGVDHPETAGALRELAFLLEECRRADEAEALHRRVLAIHERSLGAEHGEVAIDLTNLAGLLQDGGRLAEAEPLFLRALRIFAAQGRHWRRDHPHLRSAMRNYAGVLRAQGLGEEEIAARLQAALPVRPRKGKASLHSR